MIDAVLRARAITRRWGGLLAVDNVSLELAPRTVHALIGPNGAGKSTLVNVLAGDIAATSGAVELLGADVTGWPQPRRARAGLGRSYQRTSIFPELSVLENCRLAAQAQHPAPWHWWRDAQRGERSVAAGRRAAARAGLVDHLHRPAGELSHGEQRQVEIALCLATEPPVLLLDEPLAGMGAEETERMLALLARLKSDHAILLVEHDTDAVFRIADRVTVMVDGAVLASGAARAVRENAAVQAAYLGTTVETTGDPTVGAEH